ncbi:MAG TPA: hypothetical protein VFV58_32910 [Blastocatellia bacterium]|nr:hypothetical protein [Blastocatellia bacterium]
MKKKLYALSGVFLIVLVIAGLWATKAVSFMDTAQTIDPAAVTSSAMGGMSMQQMVGESSEIIIGQCIATQSQWIEGRRLVTLATVEVAETLKGASVGKVTVVMPGGVDANRPVPVAMNYPGAPTMSRDEEVALFLVPHDEVAGGYAVIGFSAGKFSIAQTNTGEKVVARDMTKAPIQKGSGLTRGNSQSIPLPVFREMVKEYLKK